MKTDNSKGKVYYGMHFYPGIAEYAEPGKEPYRVFLNENTIRQMDPTFAGRPVYVMHVDEVEPSLDELRKDADGWVVESFFNETDGKHWVKFLVVSEKGERAIKNGMRLSNCYVQKNVDKGGLWNGVSYLKEITGAEYEHLAIVPNPRYEESVIMTPDEFKKYNDDNKVELKRIANSNEGKGRVMKLKLFKRKIEKIENDLDDMVVVLPKSLKEVGLLQLVNEADLAEEKKPKDGEKMMANGDHHVAVGDKLMTVNELVEKHKAMCDALEAAKGGESGAEGSDVDHVLENKDGGKDADGDYDGDKKKENEDEDKKDEKKKNDLAIAEAKEAEVDKKKAADKEKADRLRNANTNALDEPVRIDLSEDMVLRGKARYGSK